MKQADRNFSFHWTICSPTQGKSWTYLDFGEFFFYQKEFKLLKKYAHVCY